MIECPVCEMHVPDDIKGGRKWRWMAVHIAQHKDKRKKGA